MEQIVKEYFAANPSCIDKLFTGIYRSIVKCGSCQYESITYVPFAASSLNIEDTLEKSLKREYEVS